MTEAWIAPSCSRVREPRCSHRDSETPGEGTDHLSDKVDCDCFDHLVNVNMSIMEIARSLTPTVMGWQRELIQRASINPSRVRSRDLQFLSSPPCSCWPPELVFSKPPAKTNRTPPCARELSRPPRDGVTGRVLAWCISTWNIQVTGFSQRPTPSR